MLNFFAVNAGNGYITRRIGMFEIFLRRVDVGIDPYTQLPVGDDAHIVPFRNTSEYIKFLQISNKQSRTNTQFLVGDDAHIVPFFRKKRGAEKSLRTPSPTCKPQRL